MNDPNFPSNLDIRPLHLTPSDSSDVWKQQDAIKQYGIAGRIWEASSALIEYFTTSSTTFNPRCSIFNRLTSGTSQARPEGQIPTQRETQTQDGFAVKEGQKRIIELGSGQSVASLHLASQLQNDDLLVLTDLPNVVPLIQQSVDTWTDNQSRSLQSRSETSEIQVGCKPIAEPMAWGADIGHLEKYGEFTHVVCCDLVYFPNLYPPLLRTLLQLTDRHPDQPSHPDDNEVFGLEVILAYKSRTLALEQSFFDSLALYFRLEPVIGGQTEAKIYLCRRWRVTDEWEVPAETDIMNGSKEVIKGSSGFGLFEEMLGAIEWD